MLEGTYNSREPRVHVSGTTASVARRRLLFLRAPTQDADALLDLSASGMKILASGPAPAAGDHVDVTLAHAALKGPVALSGKVQWVRPEPGKADTWGAGIHFDSMRDTTRVALERLIVLELGSSVRSTLAGHLGFVARAAAEVEPLPTFFVYDVERRKLATITEEPLFYRVERTAKDDGRPGHRDFEKLQAALRWVYDVETVLEVEPALEPPPRRMG